jgi:hypothetical protein
VRIQVRKAQRRGSKLKLALFGPWNAGKTYSALALATGIVRVDPGPIVLIDTEEGRSLKKAGRFDFDVIELGAPFSPERYVSALDAAVAHGARVIIVDQMSYEHEGTGGVLDMHTEEVERRYTAALRYNDRAKRETFNYPAWGVPKAQRRRLELWLAQNNRAHTILNFRAKKGSELEKGKGGRTEIKDRGMVPIGADDFHYIQESVLYLPHGSNGVPCYEPGASDGWRVDDDHQGILKPNRVLDESVGEELARAALSVPVSDSQPPPAGPPQLSERGEDVLARIVNAPLLDDLDKILDELKSSARLPNYDRRAIAAALEQRRATLMDVGDEPEHGTESSENGQDAG